MVVVNLPSNITYNNLYSLSGFDAGTSLILTNNTSSPAFIVQASVPPLASSDQYPLLPGQTVLVHANADPIWIRGGKGPFIVQSLLETITPFTGIDLPHDLYTSDNEGFRRLRVDVAQTGFFEGREFRTFLRLNIPTSGTIYVRAIVPINLILFSLDFIIVSGQLDSETRVGGTPSGTWSTALPIFNRNNMTEVPGGIVPTSVVQLHTGGSHSGGTVLDVNVVKASNDTPKGTSVGNQPGDERGIAANTYYFKLQNLDAGNPLVGVFKARWEERP